MTLHNLKQAAKTLNFLTEHGIDTYPDLESRVAEITAASDEAAAALKAMEHRLADMAVLIKNVTTYKQLRPVSMEYRKAKDKAQFRREHESTLILYEAAAKALKEQGVKKLPDLYALSTLEGSDTSVTSVDSVISAKEPAISNRHGDSHTPLKASFLSPNRT